MIKNVFKCTRNEDDGCLYIAASSVPAKYILPHILESYMEEYPDAVFKVMEADSSTVIETVLRGNAHIGFTGARFKKNHCTYIPFYDDEMVVITPNNLKFRKLKELHFGKKFSELKTTDIPCAETYWIEKEKINYSICFGIGTKVKDGFKFCYRYEQALYRRVSKIISLRYGFAPFSTYRLLKYIDTYNPDIVH